MLIEGDLGNTKKIIMEKEFEKLSIEDLEGVRGGIPYDSIDKMDPSVVRKEKIEQLKEEQEKLKQFQKDLPTNEKSR